MSAETLECGWCHKPLQPGGKSLYFCDPGAEGADSVCQKAWTQAQPTDPKAFRKFPYEEFVGYVASDILRRKLAVSRRDSSPP